MYTIYLLLSGKFYCMGKLQDGTERWEEDTLEEAIKSMKSFAKALNGTKIKKKDIEFFKERACEVSEFVPWQPGGKTKRSRR